jgi:glycosyltransferase involved in cell wall biosynthesis
MDTTPEIKNNSPLVSILMLTYNRASYIEAAIKSVLNQTYHNWELHIIDDGSTDTTAELVAHFSDPRIHYHRHTENRGLIIRRQESLSYVTGTYSAIIDSDDVWSSSNKLSAQVAHMETLPDCAVVGTFIHRIDETGNITGTDTYATTDKAIRRHILLRNQFAHSSVLMRTALVRQTAGYRDTMLAEDLDIFLQLGRLGTFANLAHFYTSYRVHGQSFGRERGRMARAIITIIKNHQAYYPLAWLALSKAYVRWWLTLLK